MDEEMWEFIRDVWLASAKCREVRADWDSRQKGEGAMAYEVKDGQGALFSQDTVSDAQPGYSGYLSYRGERIPIVAWSKQARSGQIYLSLKVDTGTKRRDMAPKNGRGEAFEADDSDVPF